MTEKNIVVICNKCGNTMKIIHQEKEFSDIFYVEPCEQCSYIDSIDVLSPAEADAWMEWHNMSEEKRYRQVKKYLRLLTE